MIKVLLSVILTALNEIMEYNLKRRANFFARLFNSSRNSYSLLFYFFFLNFLVFFTSPSLLAQSIESMHERAQEIAEPTEYRTNDYRSPVPRTLKGAKVITSNEAEKLIANRSAVFIDVYPRAPKPDNLPEGTIWKDAKHSTIEGAYWMPNVGYGVLSSDVETYFKTRLEVLTNKEKNHPIVFLCVRDCWMSWNAAKRAISWGYSSVHWFPEGTDGWMMLGNSLISVDPMP